MLLLTVPSVFFIQGFKKLQPYNGRYEYVHDIFRRGGEHHLGEIKRRNKKMPTSTGGKPAVPSSPLMSSDGKTTSSGGKPAVPLSPPRSSDMKTTTAIEQAFGHLGKMSNSSRKNGNTNRD
jgi:hypothetical protein